MTWAGQIAVVAVVCGLVCPLAGVFLVLRRLSMMADAISHSVLPGLVAAYVLAQGPNIWAGLAGATAAGLLTVGLVELIVKSRLVKNDAAIGLVFPAMFAVGVFFVTANLSQVHIDADAILFGEIAFAPAEQMMIAGSEAGPQSAWLLGVVGLVNLLVLTIFFKELKLTTFDAGLAATLGFAPAAMHIAVMAMAAVTTVGAFSAVGAVLAVAMIIAPAAAASLWTDRLPWLILLSCLLGAGSSLAGYGAALALDVSISGMMAAMAGVVFLLSAAFAPGKGIAASLVRRRRQAWQFAVEMLVIHLGAHEGEPGMEAEGTLLHIERELNWTAARLRKVSARAKGQGLIAQAGGRLTLTEAGRQAQEALLLREASWAAKTA